MLKLLVFEQKSISTGSWNSSKPKSMARYARKSFLIKYSSRCLLLCCRNMAADFRSESKLFPKDPSFPLETFSSQLKTRTTNAGGLQTTSKYEHFKLQSLVRSSKTKIVIIIAFSISDSVGSNMVPNDSMYELLLPKEDHCKVFEANC